MPETSPRFETAPTVSNHFSWIRTRLSLERTFMAWMRTSVSLIGFGFTIAQFFSRMKEMSDNGPRPMGEETPRDLGLALIAAGIGGLLVSSLQYRQGLKYLWNREFQSIRGFGGGPQHTPAFYAAMVLILVGVVTFMAVLFRFD